MVSLALRVVLALIGLEDPDAQAALAEQGFETWAQGFEDFAAMVPGGTVDLSPVRRDMELFFAVVQYRGGAFYVKQSLRLQATTGSFGVPTSRRTFVSATPSASTPLTSTATSSTVTSLRPSAAPQVVEVVGKAKRHADPSTKRRPCHREKITASRL